MLSINKIKYLRSLSIKKYRLAEQKFLLEGFRIIYEAINSSLIFEHIWIDENLKSDKDIKNLLDIIKKKNIKYNFESEKKIDSISNTKNTQGIIALVNIKDFYNNKTFTDEVVILDYKATSTKEKINYVTSLKSYHKSYLRQLDFYAYLLKLNKFKVFKTGYWILCNARKDSQKTFGDKLNFKIDLLSYDLNTDYIEESLVELEKCYNSEKIPPSNPICDTCRWHKETSKL